MVTALALVAAIASAQTVPATDPGTEPEQAKVPAADPESATRYAGLDDAEAWRLARTVLPAPLPLPLDAARPTAPSGGARAATSATPAAPAASAAPAKVEYRGDYAALVHPAGGKKPSLVATSFPLRTRDAKGRARPVDLRLRRRGAYLVPANAGTDVKLARSLQRSSLLGGIGLRVRPVGRRGRIATARQSSTAFYANAVKSTDISVAAQPGGLQAMWVLRAASSPETVALELAAKQLRLRRRPNGEVVVRGKGGKPIALIRAAVAWDARGVAVPVEVSVKGDRVSYHIAHRGRKLQYPIVVDPVVVGHNWVTAADTAGWQAGTMPSGHSSAFAGGLQLSYTGVRVDPGFAEWRYTAPGGGTITEFSPGVVAMASEGSPTTCGSIGLRTSGGAAIDTSGASTCAATIPLDTYLAPVDVPANQGNVAFFRHLPVANETMSASALLPGATIRLDDDDLPAHGALATSHPPGQWINESSVWIETTATDAGLGMRRFELYDPVSGARPAVLNGGCTGTAAAPCSTTFSARFSPAAELIDGAGQDFSISAEDALGKGTSRTVTFKVDREKPVLTLGGTLSEGAILKSGHRAVDVSALDGDPALGNSSSITARRLRRAGVRSIRVKLDGATQSPDAEQTCEHSCALNRSFPVDPDTLGHGNHTVEVIATDQAGNARSVTRSFAVDKRGPDIGLTGPLMDARGSTLTKESYRLDITAQDGVHGSAPESGTRRIEVLWQDTGSSTWQPLDEVDRACATDSCSLEHQFTFEPRKFDGAGRLLIKAWDELDNIRQEVVDLSPGTAAYETTALSGLEEYLQFDSVETGAGGRAHVNQTTGNLVWNLLPLVNPGRGLSTFANVTYNSQTGPPEGTFAPYDEIGLGFSLGISTITRVNEPLDLSELESTLDPHIALVDPDGTRHVFKEHTSGEYYVPPAGFNVHLRRYSNAYARTWAATRPDGATYFFDQQGYATSIEDRNGNVLRFAYEIVPLTGGASCPAWAVTTPMFDADDCRQRLVSVTDSAGVLDGAPNRSVGIAYEAGGDGRIASLTDHAGRVLRFTYSGGRLTALTQADGTDEERTHRFLYGPDGLGAVQDPRGAETRFRYGSGYEAALDDAAHAPDELSDTRVERVTQRDGRRRDYTYLDGPDGADELVWETRASNARGEVTRYATDHRGRTKKITDPRGTDTLLRWDGDNNVTLVREAAGTSDAAQTEMGYNANGQLEWITNPEDERTDLHYAVGQGVHQRPAGEPLEGFVSDLNQIETPKGDATGIPGDFAELYELDARGNVTGRRDGDGNWSRTAFDSYGQVVKETDAIGNVTRYERYDASGLARVMIDPKQGRWEYAYDAVGNLLATSDPRSAEHGGVSDSAHRFKARFSYDALDQLVGEILPKDSRAGEFITRTYDHDANGNPERSVDGTGAATTQVFDEMDRPTAVRTPAVPHADEESPAPETTRMEYDGEGLVTRETRPRGEENAGSALDYSTDYEYDGNGQLVVERRHQLEPGGQLTSLITSRAYDRRGNLVGIADPRRNAGTSLSPIDAVASAAHRRWTYEYDLADRRIGETEDPSGEALLTRYEYDVNDNLTRTISPRNHAATRSYDGRDLLVDSTNAAGETTQYRRRADGRVEEIRHPRYFTAWDPNEFVERFVYDAAGDVVEHRLPRTDTANEPETPPTWKYQRDAIGDAVKVTDPRGDVFQSTFLDSGSVRTTTRPSAWKVEGDALVPKAWREMVNDAERPELPSSDGAGDGEAEAEGDFGAVEPAPAPGLLPKAGRTQFGYDAELRLTSVTELLDVSKPADDVTTRIERDALGRMTKLVRPRDTAVGAVITELTAYDRNGNVAAATDGELATTRFVYDQFDRPVEHHAPPGSGGTPEVTKVAYTPNGQVASTTTPRGTVTHSCYDRADRLESVTDPLGAYTSYDYDADGNRTFEGGPRAFNADAQPTSCTNWPGPSDTPTAQTVDRTHDEVGRVLTEREGGPSSPRLTAYEYDLDGNISKVTAPGANADAQAAADAVQARVSEFRHDGRGFLYRTKVTGSDRVRFTVQERDALGNLRRVVDPEGVDDNGQREHADAAPLRTSIDVEDDRENDALQPATEHATLYEYSPDNLLTSIHLPNGGGDDQRYRQTFHLDARGRATKIDAPNEWTKAPALCSGDVLDQSYQDVTKTACVQRTEYAYLDTGWITSSTEPKGRRKIENGGEASVGGEIHTYEYDDRGLQTGWTVANAGEVVRRVSTRSYWPNGKLRSRIADRPGNSEPEEKTREYDYRWSANGKLISVLDRGLETSPLQPGDDRVYRLGYDAADRLIATDEDDLPARGEAPARPGADTAMQRDLAGNVTHRWHNGRLDGAAVTSAGTVQGAVSSYTGGTLSTFSYDDFDQETKAVIEPPHDDDARQQIETAYWPSGDRRSRVESTFEPDSAPTARLTEWNGWSTDGRPWHTKRQQRGQTAFEKDQGYRYNPNGDRTQDETGTYVVNARHQLTRWNRLGEGSPAVEYTLNGAGDVLEEKDAADQSTTRYSYAAGRLAEERTERGGPEPSTEKLRYGYDTASANVESISSITGPETSEQRIKQADFRYDAFDRVTSQGVYRAGQGTPEETDDDEDVETLTYDAFDRRDQITEDADRPDSDPDPATADFGYIGTTDALSRRTPLNRPGSAFSAWDYDSQMEAVGQRRSLTADGEQLTYRTFGKDVNGSVERLSDESGAEAARYRFDPYGTAVDDQQRQEPGGLAADTIEQSLPDFARDNPIRFQGFYYDSGVRTYDMRARQYLPSAGRFLTQDRFEASTGDFNLVADPLTQNRYAFAGGNPISNVEFDGHAPCREELTPTSDPCPTREQLRRAREILINAGHIPPSGRLSEDEANRFLDAYERNHPMETRRHWELGGRQRVFDCLTRRAKGACQNSPVDTTKPDWATKSEQAMAIIAWLPQGLAAKGGSSLVGRMAAAGAEKATQSNYRKLFIKNVGKLPNKNYQVHHALPQRYSEQLAKHGVNVHDVALLRGVHQRVHTRVTNEWEAWHRDIVNRLGRPPTTDEIIVQSYKIDAKYGKQLIFPKQ